MTTITDLSANSVAWGWVSPEDFVKDMSSIKYKPRESLYYDLSGEALIKKRKEIFDNGTKELEKLRRVEFARYITPVGSNANWGRITQPNEMGGTPLDELGINDIKSPLTKYKKNDYLVNDTLCFYNEILREKVETDGELTGPLVKAIEEEEDDENTFFCKGCSKHFATKSSLKRHHERKKSCKDICEAKPEEVAKAPEVPEKPYIVDWVDEVLSKSISGDSEKPYCKHCDVEFANKTNLHKHLSKSVACDKLAKQGFLNILGKV